MAKRVNVTLPPDVRAELEAFQREAARKNERGLNVSAVCAAAIRDAIRRAREGKITTKSA